MSFKEWKVATLEDVCYFGADKIETDKVTNVNYISTENMLPDRGGVTIASNLPSTKTVSKYEKSDVLVSNIRPYFKKIWFATNSGGSSNDVLIFKNKDSSKLDNKYLYYYLSKDDFFNYVTASAKGTKMPRGDKGAIMKYEINLPPIQEQEAIVNILSSLDEEIEINNQINRKLEEMSQVIFKQWFVNFEFPNEDGEPYKSSGGEMAESELGMIPNGWEVVSLGDLIDVVDNRGKTPPLSKEETPYPIIDVKALSGENRIINYINCTKFVEKETYENWFRSGHPSPSDILLSTVGSIGEMKIFYGNIGCIAQNVVALRCTNISPYFLYQYLKHIKNDLVSYNIGSVQPSIKITHVIKHKILIPKQDIQDKFITLNKQITDMVYENFMQIQLLSNIRDTLLSKLMSGKIRVPIKSNYE